MAIAQTTINPTVSAGGTIDSGIVMNTATIVSVDG
jgi:hypothetical protein